MHCPAEHRAARNHAGTCRCGYPLVGVQAARCLDFACLDSDQTGHPLVGGQAVRYLDFAYLDGGQTGSWVAFMAIWMLAPLSNHSNTLVSVLAPHGGFPMPPKWVPRTTLRL